MNIVYYSSDFFAEMCGVAMESLFCNNKEVTQITVYIVEDKISEKNKKRLQDIAERHKRELVFVRMPSQEECYPGVTINLGRTYVRMALGEILPESVERVLSLDSDTLVLDSLQEMYDTSFDREEYVAGVYDCVGSAIQKKVLHTPDDLHYCNAGMFLIDLKKWRKEKVGKQLLETLTQKTSNQDVLYFLEQDLMNTVFYGHLRLLHPRYNLLTSIALFNYDEIMKMKKPVSYYSHEEINSAKEKPALIHATTCFYVKKRMWVENSDHPFSNQYRMYRDKTAWKSEPMVADGRTKKKKIYAGFWHLMPRSCAVFCASFLINCIRPWYAKITSKLKITTIATQSST